VRRFVLKRFTRQALVAGLVVAVACKDGTGTAADYTLSVAPTAVTIVQGATGTSTVTITRTSFTGAVTLSLGNAPTGVTGAFAPTAPTGTSSTLTVSVGAAVTPGVYNLTVGGTATAGNRSTPLTLTVSAPPDYELSLAPTALTITQGATGTATVAITRTNFTGAVTLSLGNAPPGVTGTFDPAAPTGTSSTLTVSVAATVAPGEYHLTVDGTGTPGDRSTPLTLTVSAAPNYALSLASAALTIDQGATGTTTVTLTRINFTDAVTLRLGNAPAGVTGTFDPAAPTGTTSTLTVSVSATVAPGLYNLTVDGSGTVGNRSTPLTLTVSAAPNYALSLTPAALTIVQGATGTATVTITRTNFTGAVPLSLSGAPAGVSGSFDPAAPTGTSSTLTLSVGAAVEPRDDYVLTVEGSGSPGSRSTSLTLTVTVTDPCAYANAPPVTVGQTVNGALAAGDCVISGKYTDQYDLTLASATKVQVEMTGSPLNTYLTLINRATSALVASNDDDALSGTPNSRINVQLPSGAYIIRATSFSAGATGAYQLRVCNSAPSPIAPGQTLSGTLEVTDCGLAATGDGSFIDRWQFTLAVPMNVTLTQTSAAFDAFLWLLNSAETSVLAADDDGGGGTDARIVMAGASRLQPGTYNVWTNSFSPGETGAYQLSLAAEVDYCSLSTPISNPQTVNGELTGADCRLSDGSYADRWEITLTTTTALRIDMTSAAFDAFLFMRDASNNTVASDDDGAGGTNARIEGTFPAGTYIIWANSFLPGTTGAYSLAVSTPPAGTVNLHIDRLYLVQSTQAYGGSVPLVSGRDALLRVFVRADQANAVAPEVRVSTYISGVLQSTRTIAAPGASVSTALSEGSLTSSWNVIIPAAEVQPGAQILADVDPTNAIAEGNEGDNIYPASGTPAALDVRTIPTFYVTLVPVVQSANGLTGDVSVGNQDSFLNSTRKMWPFSTVAPVIHTPYTTTTPRALAADGTNWSPVLSELRALRTAEGSSRHYYGAVKVGYTSGVAGLGYIGFPTAMGWDYLPSGDGVLAHELGHNFNRLHAPCGNPGNPDPNYPYALGAIGVYGYDVAGASLKARTMPDLMSYCHPEWISDYTFRGALDYIVSHPTSPVIVGGPAASVLIWGRIDDGKLVLEPAIEVMAAPSPLPPSGPYRLQGTDASGRTILNLTFAPDEVADAPTPTQHFAFVVPKSALSGAVLSALQVSGPAGASASLRSSGATDNAALVDAAATATRRAAGLVEVRWDAARYPLAVIRSTVTGEILSFARGGVVAVPDAGAELEVILSDGVRSAARRLVPGQ